MERQQLFSCPRTDNSKNICTVCRTMVVFWMYHTIRDTIHDWATQSGHSIDDRFVHIVFACLFLTESQILRNVAEFSRTYAPVKTPEIVHWRHESFEVNWSETRGTCY